MLIIRYSVKYNVIYGSQLINTAEGKKNIYTSFPPNSGGNMDSTRNLPLFTLSSVFMEVVFSQVKFVREACIAHT